ncbi:MAG: sulfatase/phosphatase domain-containing protein, partial [Bacillota bacterium]
YFSGKWHVSAVESPANRGWDMKEKKAEETEENNEIIYQKPEASRWEDYKRLAQKPEKTQRNEAEILRPGYPLYTHYGIKEDLFKDEDKVEDGIKKLKTRERSDEPWCQFIGTLGPHDPYFVPEEFLEKYDIEDIELPDNFYDDLKDKPNLYQRTQVPFNQLTEEEHREAIRHYLAFCSYEDYLFGKVLDTLDEIGQKENTLVIYLSDHGDYMAEHGLWCKGLPNFKSSYHVPCAVRWPEGIKTPGRVVEEFVSLADFAPTLLEVAGISVEREFTGNSLVPFLKNNKVDNWRDEIYTQSNGNELYGIQRSVMTDKWKYVYNGFDFDELYDLENDPDELNNVIDDPENQEIVRKLCGKLWEFAQKTDDTCINPYIMVGLAPYGPGEAFRD